MVAFVQKTEVLLLPTTTHTGQRARSMGWQGTCSIPNAIGMSIVIYMIWLTSSKAVLALKPPQSQTARIPTQNDQDWQSE